MRALGQKLINPEKAQAGAEWSSGVATLVILVGIVIEIVSLFVFSAGKPGWEIALGVIADVLVIGGLAAEFVCVLVTIAASSQIKAESDAKLGEAVRLASEANERAAQASERAAKAELELAQIKLPRNITPEQHAAIVAALSGLPKGPVYMRPALLDAEAKEYGRQIEAILREANFEIKSVPEGEASLSWSIPGAFLIVREPGRAPQHAASIQRGFEQVGILLLAQIDKDHPENEVSIGIGARP